MSQSLQIVIIKPSKYLPDGTVERFHRGFMPNSTVPYMRSMTPSVVGGTPVEVHTIDEYVHTDLRYMSLLNRPQGGRTLLALVGVQSHQFHRALDLAAFARSRGCMAVIGGPHVMTCDTSMLHGRGVSFAQSEAELIWLEILRDAAAGELQPVYGRGQRWQQEIEAPVIVPPGRKDLGRYVIPMLGLYPARGCPFLCNFCSVIKIAGRKIRSQSIDTTLASLRAAKAAGVRTIMFTSDNFNKYPEAEALLGAMIDEQLGLEFFVQCDTQIARQEHLVDLLAKAGCFQMFIGVESFNRQVLIDFFNSNHDQTSAFFTVGIKDEEFEKLRRVRDKADVRFACVDAANGYTKFFVERVKRIREAFPDLTIMAGNVVTPDMVQELLISGAADIVKIGIGSGSVCTTRIKAAVGYPQLSAIIECADAAHGLWGHVCADGGCRTPGDVVKAFAAGADFVMLGSMLAGHDECEGEWIEEDGKRVSMRFYGMSSRTAMDKYAGGRKDYRACEGKEVFVPCRGPVKETLQEITGGIRSACAVRRRISFERPIEVYDVRDLPSNP